MSKRLSLTILFLLLLAQILQNLPLPVHHILSAPQINIQSHEESNIFVLTFEPFGKLSYIGVNNRRC